MESNYEALDINSMPEEMLIRIFRYLSQNELGQIARVCRKWNILTKCPVLWKGVDVYFSESHGSQNSVAKHFINSLPPSVSFIRLNLKDRFNWIEPLDFKDFSTNLQVRCPHLKMLILEDCILSENLPTVIDLCTLFLPNLRKLVFRGSQFLKCTPSDECSGTSKIEILDVKLSILLYNNKPPFSRMPYLKKLHLYNSFVEDSWFGNGVSFFSQLRVLNLGATSITSRTFQVIQKHALNLVELYLCYTDLKDGDLNVNNSMFPHLKTICLKSRWKLACESIIPFIQSCPSLLNIYVDAVLAQSFKSHSSVESNKYNMDIVKAIDNCFQDHDVDYVCK